MKNSEEKMKSPLRRKVFVLTCWQERDDGAKTMIWRFNVETLQPGRKRLFSTLRDVMAAIEEDLQFDPGNGG